MTHGKYVVRFAAKSCGKETWQNICVFIPEKSHFGVFHVTEDSQRNIISECINVQVHVISEP